MLAFVDVCNVVLHGILTPLLEVGITELLVGCETKQEPLNDVVGNDVVLTVDKGSDRFN